MKFMTHLCLGAALLLSGCDVVMKASINEDATITTSVVSYFDQAGCAAAMRVSGGKEVCVVSDEEGIAFNSETNKYESTGPGSPKTESFEQFAKNLSRQELGSVTHDEEARTVAIDLSVKNLSSLARRGPSNTIPEPATKFDFGEPDSYDGKLLQISVSAKEILESTGQINDDGTRVIFEIPMVYFVYGHGDVGYDEISLVARY